MKKVMLKKAVIPVFFATILTFGLSNSASASNDISITFNVAPSLKLNLDGDLTIANLQPGLCSLSDTATLNIYTNNVTGYKLTATVGGADPDDQTRQYTTSDLIHSDSTITSKFSMLSIGANQSEIGAGNWGYSLDGGTTYNGLPLYTDTTNITVISSSTAATEDSVDINIGACAETGKLSGTYSNVINFTAVANYVEGLDDSDTTEENNEEETPALAKSTNYSSYNSTSSTNSTPESETNDEYVAPLGVVKSEPDSTATTETSTTSNLGEILTALAISSAVGIGVFFILKDQDDEDEEQA